MHRRADPRRTYLALEAATSLFFTLGFTLNLVYFVDEIGLSPLQMVLVGTVMEATLFVAEIPTGVVADLYSRRLSVILGATLIGLSLLLQGAVATSAAVFAGQVVWSLGYTFTSGATQAWITDELGEDAVQPVFTRAAQLGLTASFAGILLAGGAAALGLRAPLLVAGTGYLVTALVLAVVMPENGFRPTPPVRRETSAAVRRTLGDALEQARRRPVVRTVLAVSLVIGLGSEAVDRLWVQHVSATFDLPDVPLLSLGGERAGAFTLFALVGAVVSLVASLAVNRWAPQAVAHPHPNLFLAGFAGIQALGVLVFAFSGNLWAAMAGLWVREAAAVVAGPVEAAWVNRHVDAASRATVLSVSSQLNAVGEIAGGPPLGLLARARSIPVALVGAAVLLSPAVVLYARLRPERDDTAPRFPDGRGVAA